MFLSFYFTCTSYMYIVFVGGWHIAFTYYLHRELIYNVIWSRFLHVFVLSWWFIRPGFRGFLSKVSGRALYKYLVPLKMSQFPSLYVRIYNICKSSKDRRRKKLLMIIVKNERRMAPPNADIVARFTASWGVFSLRFVFRSVQYCETLEG